MAGVEAIVRGVLLAAAFGWMFAIASREVFKLMDPDVLVVSGLRVHRPWFRQFVLVFFVVGTFAVFVAPLTFLFDPPRELASARWVFIGTPVFDAIWLAGLIKQFRDSVPPPP